LTKWRGLDGAFASPALKSAIPRESPEVSGLGFGIDTWIKDRSTGLVHEQFGRALQVGDQRIEDGTQIIGWLQSEPTRSW